MCGLTGIVIGGGHGRLPLEAGMLGQFFTELLVHSEHRGPYATGAALVRGDGTRRVVKAPLPASKFAHSKNYRRWLNEIDDRAVYLMGHTRWPSRGSVYHAEENHPIWTSPVLLSHNGTICDHARHATRMGLEQATDVDSELLARIAQRHTDGNGIDVQAVLAALKPLTGSMSMAMVATCRPDEVVLLKGNMPLAVWVHPQERVLIYASETEILEDVVGGEPGWKNLPLAYWEGLVFNSAKWSYRRVPFSFGLSSANTSSIQWQRFTGV